MFRWKHFSSFRNSMTKYLTILWIAKEPLVDIWIPSNLEMHVIGKIFCPYHTYHASVVTQAEELKPGLHAHPEVRGKQHPRPEDWAPSHASSGSIPLGSRSGPSVRSIGYTWDTTAHVFGVKMGAEMGREWCGGMFAPLLSSHDVSSLGRFLGWEMARLVSSSKWRTDWRME